MLLRCVAFQFQLRRAYSTPAGAETPSPRSRARTYHNIISSSRDHSGGRAVSTDVIAFQLPSPSLRVVITTAPVQVRGCARRVFACPRALMSLVSCTLGMCDRVPWRRRGALFPSRISLFGEAGLLRAGKMEQAARK